MYSLWQTRTKYIYLESNCPDPQNFLNLFFILLLTKICIPFWRSRRADSKHKYFFQSFHKELFYFQVVDIGKNSKIVSIRRKIGTYIWRKRTENWLMHNFIHFHFFQMKKLNFKISFRSSNPQHHHHSHHHHFLIIIYGVSKFPVCLNVCWIHIYTHIYIYIANTNREFSPCCVLCFDFSSLFAFPSSQCVRICSIYIFVAFNTCIWSEKN